MIPSGAINWPKVEVRHPVSVVDLLSVFECGCGACRYALSLDISTVLPRLFPPLSGLSTRVDDPANVMQVSNTSILIYLGLNSANHEPHRMPAPTSNEMSLRGGQVHFVLVGLATSTRYL